MRRAREHWQKEERSRAILQVAERLFTGQDATLPPVELVAREAGIAKGTVYLYFHSREAIFLSLLEWRAFDWIDEVHRGLEKASGRMTPETITGAVLDYPLRHPVVMDLASLSSTVLEANVDFDTAFRFKSGLTTRLMALGGLVSRKHPRMSEEGAARCFLRSYSYLVGLWQVAQPPAILQEARRKIDAALFRIDFEAEAREGLLALWTTVFRRSEASARAGK